MSGIEIKQKAAGNGKRGSQPLHIGLAGAMQFEHTLNPVSST